MNGILEFLIGVAAVGGALSIALTCMVAILFVGMVAYALYWINKNGG